MKIRKKQNMHAYGREILNRRAACTTFAFSSAAYMRTQQTKAIAMKFEPRRPSTPTARVLFTLRRWSSPGIDFSIYVVPESMNLD